MQFPPGGLKSQVEKSIGKQAMPTIRSRLQTIVERAQKRAVEEFDKHDITKEIEAGAFKKGSELGYGNLYSYIGFKSNPIPTIRNILQTNPTISNGRKLPRQGTYRYIVTHPSIEDVYADTPIPDGYVSGRSWVALLERGLVNFSTYLFAPNRTFTHSRSGTGVQTRTSFRDDSQYSSQYIRGILENYKQSILRGRR